MLRSLPVRLVQLSSFGETCGVATYTEALVAAMRDAGQDIDVIAPHLRVGVTQRGQQPERAWGHTHASLRQARRVAGMLRDRAVDLVHLQFNHGLFSMRFIVGLTAACRAHGIEVVATLHGRGGGDLWRRAKWAVVRQALARAHLLVHTEQHAVELAPRRATVIAHGIGAVERRDLGDAKRAAGIAPETPVIAHFGFITPDKGIAEVVEALPVLRERHPSLMYLVVGGVAGHRKSQRHLHQLRARIAALGLDEHVRLDGSFKDNPQVVAELSAADWVVLNYQTGDRQGASGAARHALVAGRPLALSAAPVFDDMRDATATLSSPLTDAIDQLLSDPEQAERVQQTAEAYCRRNSWKAIAEQHLALYRKILGLSATQS